MTHEFKNIVEVAFKNPDKKHVLATVVALDGSSYRKPGVQMLLSEDGHMTGAVSGGCVEKEILFQSESVLKTNTPKVITYDGRYRLGCEGILYILLEPFSVSKENYELITNTLISRKSFEIYCTFKKEVNEDTNFKSILKLNNGINLTFTTSDYDIIKNQEYSIFSQTFKPLSQLIIIGAEHDAVTLSQMTALLGWEVSIIDSPRDPKDLDIFPGAKTISHLDPEMDFDFTIDNETAIVLMTHNYARDLHFLLKLQSFNPMYIGILGSAKRRDKLMNELIELQPELDFNFMDCIYGPAGIHIGAITPQEIAVSILGEIIAIRQQKEVPSLRMHNGSIHL